MANTDFEFTLIYNKLVLKDVAGRSGGKDFVYIFDTPYQMAKFIGEIYGFYEVKEEKKNEDCS